MMSGETEPKETVALKCFLGDLFGLIEFGATKEESNSCWQPQNRSQTAS